jgi:hypothetical protein
MTIERYVRPSDYDALAAEFAEYRRVDAMDRKVAEARIRELEAALHEIADFSEQFIGDDEDGDERMYKVNQIADTALACAASGAITALDRKGEHGK